MNTSPFYIAIISLSLFSNTTSADTVNTRFPEFPHNKDHVFTRMFPQLPPFAPQTPEMRAQMQELGAIGGLLDAHDNLTDPIQSIINPAVFSPFNPDNPNMTAGVTFFGQFLDHDITLNKTSPLDEKANPRRTINFRTAAFDLDSVYGEGPSGSTELYETSSGFIKFITEAIPGSEAVSRHGAMRYDLPRDVNGEAIIGDSRNDENIIISQFHLAMLKFHNAVTDQLAAKYDYNHDYSDKVFREARQTVRWHYQWIILHEFLPTIIGQERLDTILIKGLKHYDINDPENYHLIMDKGGHTLKTPRIPIEFSVAAYRFGHSQVRPSYRVNFGPSGGSPFFSFVFDDALDPGNPDPGDTRGGKRAARRFIDWETFFNFGDGNFRPNKRIDSKLSSVLMLMPGSKGPSPGLPSDGVQSLASRNLIRHVNFGLPSGQDVARKLKLPVLTAEQLADLAPYHLETSTPLWFYILKEAEVMENGLRLGPVGSQIVGEVFVGLLKADKTAYLNAKPDWKPTLSSDVPGTFRTTDLLKFAGVVPPL